MHDFTYVQYTPCSKDGIQIIEKKEKAPIVHICMIEDSSQNSVILPVDQFDIMSKPHGLQLSNHLVALRHLNSGIVDQLINNCLSGLLLVDHSSGLTHQVRTGVVNRVVINIIRQVFKVVLDRNDTLGGQLLDILGTVFFPVLNVGVLADTERTTLDQVSDKLQKSIVNKECLTVKIMVRIVSSKLAVRTASW